jgi:hypothetical protein
MFCRNIGTIYAELSHQRTGYLNGAVKKAVKIAFKGHNIQLKLVYFVNVERKLA